MLAISLLGLGTMNWIVVGEGDRGSCGNGSGLSSTGAIDKVSICWILMRSKNEGRAFKRGRRPSDIKGSRMEGDDGNLIISQPTADWKLGGSGICTMSVLCTST